MTITADQLVSLRDAGLSRQAAADRLGIDINRLSYLVTKFDLRWPKRCGKGHPPRDRVVVGGRDRCRLCYVAEMAKRRETGSRRKPESLRKYPASRSAREQVLEALETSAALDRAIARESLPRYLVHPAPYDPRDVVYRSVP